MTNPNGMILYEGPSQLDGAPIVVIATGLRQGSTNAKTGAMVQTYILRSDVAPIDAVKQGLDESICGGCTHRGDGNGKNRSCYVTLMHGPRGVYAAFKRGTYAKAGFNFELVDIGKDRMIRLGTYGDPAAVPPKVWEMLLKFAVGWTGYTHQWRSIDAALWAPLCMASADTEQDMHDAHAMGYRTFRVTPGPFENIRGKETVCPASEEAGRKTTCLECRACMGTSGKAKVSIQIAAHGVGRRNVTG